MAALGIGYSAAAQEARAGEKLAAQSQAAPEGAAPEGLEDDEGAEDLPAAKALSPIDELLGRAKDDDWQLKGLARNIVRAKGEVAWSDRKAFDSAVGKEKAKLARRFAKGELNPLLLKRLEVRVVAILTSCAVKVPKPRPDGSVGQKWAILALDDGTGQADAMCYAKAWEKYGAAIADRVDQLVMVCGEITRRTNYDKDDLHRENPAAGDVTFAVKEVYPLETAMPLVSKGVTLKLRRDDPALADKVAQIRAAAQANPGQFPLALNLLYPAGTLVKVDLGPACRTSVNIGFLSLLAKAIPQNDCEYRPEDSVSLAPREPKPWEA